MSRYIDADALIETIRNFVDTMSVCSSMDYCNGLRFMKKQAIEAAEDAPTVDAVPVVRCKDCIEYRDSVGACHYFNYEPTDEMDFCSHGIRADGERRSDD